MQPPLTMPNAFVAEQCFSHFTEATKPFFHKFFLLCFFPYYPLHVCVIQKVMNVIMIVPFFFFKVSASAVLVPILVCTSDMLHRVYCFIV